MIVRFTLEGTTWRVDLSHPVDCGLPLHFDGPQPSVFAAEPATASPMQAAGFVGSIRAGGSVNAPVVRVNPHGNGTHTESARHVCDAGPPVRDAAPGGPVPATLATARTVAARSTADDCGPAARPDDRVVDAAAVERVLDGAASPAFHRGLVLRSIPRLDPWSDYGRTGAPYLTAAAAAVLARRGVEHLVVAWPSIDRLADGGLLAAHRAFWSIEDERVGRPLATVTELARDPADVPDGPCLLVLGLPAFDLDVAPSRPLLYPATEIPT